VDDTNTSTMRCDAKEKSVFAKSKFGRKEMDALLFSASSSSSWLVDHSSRARVAYKWIEQAKLRGSLRRCP
jgi:hypothetical protein